MSVLTADIVMEPSVSVSKKTLAENSIPRSFRYACEDPDWEAIIDRLLNSFVEHGTLNLVPRSIGVRKITCLLYVGLKPCTDGYFFHKARCDACRDKRSIKWTSENTNLPFAKKETLRILTTDAGRQNVELEGVDVSNAYLHGKIDVPILTEQPTDSNNVLFKSGRVEELVM